MKTLQGETILLHGPPKVGKTQLCSRFPGPVQFLATEPGHRFIPKPQRDRLVALKPGKGWPVFRQFVKSLPDKEKPPRTVVVDTAGGLYDLCFRQVCADNKWKHPSDAGAYGPGWDSIKKEFFDGINDLFWACDEIKATLVLIDHSKEIEMETATMKLTKVGLAMPGMARGILTGPPDHIWFLGYDDMDGTEMLKSFGQSPRCLYVQGGHFIEAGTRNDSVECARIQKLSKDRPYPQILKFLNNGAKPQEKAK